MTHFFDGCQLKSELGHITADGTKKLKEFLALLKRIAAPRINEIERDKMAARKIFPTFKGCRTSVELRAILEEEYKWGTPLNKYEPKIIKSSPVISILIEASSDEDSIFSFQATPEELEYLISELKATQKITEAFFRHSQAK